MIGLGDHAVIIDARATVPSPIGGGWPSRRASSTPSRPYFNARLLQYAEVSPDRQPVTRPASLHSS